MRIGIFTNILKDKNLLTTKALINELEKRKVKYFLDSGLSVLSDKFFVISELIKRIDYLLVIGGDGTMLSVICDCAVNNVPVLGINVGRMGFLTGAETSDISVVVDNIIRSDFSIDKRYLLNATYNSISGLALNEVLIMRSGDFRLINFDVMIEDNLVDSYAADGFIVSSPTGSTAYSLSCGGPILSPRVEAFVLTPINPHSLHSRAVVVSNNETAKIRLLDARAGASIVLDGRLFSALEHNGEVIISKSNVFASFIRLKEQNFYSRLFDKLDIWSTRKVRS